jgi:protein gp37
MGKQTKIEWTDHTWNPWRGCLKVSLGCKFCYMYRDQVRYGRDPKAIVRAAPATFNAPLKWGCGRVFTCSWSDFFIEQADEWRPEAWDIIKRTPYLTYQILTKRPENIKDRLPDDWGNGWSNVWLGVSVETPAYEWRIVALEEIPAVVRFVSAEPLLSSLPNLYSYFPILDWIITGGESMSNRPANLDWFKQIRDDCQHYGVAYFHKQNGGNRKINGAWGGRLLDGIEWNQFPQDEEDREE